MSDLLGIASSGLAAYRAALNAIGDNVANAETPGYARRSVRLREAAPAGGGGLSQGEGLKFSGVRATGVERAWDSFRTADARLSAAFAGRADARAQWLGGIETALGDGPTSVGSRITAFFNAGAALAGEPDDMIRRATMLAKLEDVASAMRSTADGLAKVSDAIINTAQLDIDALNVNLAALADVNMAIKQTIPGRASRASLEDERDRLIDAIAGKIDIEATVGADGTAKLTLTGASNVTLLEQGTRGLVSMIPALDGRIALQLSYAGVRGSLPATSGTLAGLVDVADSTADKRATFDQIATDFVADVNTWSAAGYDLNGAAGRDLLVITAGAATVQMVISDPVHLAAASATEENGNILTLPALRDSNGAESRWALLVTAQAQSLSAANAEKAAASTRRDNSFAARDEVTGIDLDHEAAETMRFQQAYSASSKIIQVARDTLQSILDMF